MNHHHLKALAIEAQKPLDNPMLERFQVKHFGKFRHWYYRFFYHLVAGLKPAIALEIGIDHGHTLVHMAAGHNYTKVIGIDKRVNCACDMPYRPNIRLLYANSLSSYVIRSVENLVKYHGLIGLVFQDSSHHYEESHREFEIYSGYLAKDAIWCVDDVMDVFHSPLVDPPGKSMLTYFNELPGDKQLYKKLHHGSVIGITIL